MKEYIDREALIAEYDRVHKGAPGGARKLMVDAPAADVEEVRHGRWHTIRETTDSKTTECTACMESFFFMKKGQLNIDHMPRCPKCGAKMDGATEINVGHKEG